MATASNVTTGKPKVAGAVYFAPAGTQLPSDATTALSNTFKSLGYISEDGLTEITARESEDIKAWGGDTVLTPQTSYSKSWKFKLIEALNEDVLKAVYGGANVTSTSGAISVSENSKDLEQHVIAVDLNLTGNRACRIVIPKGKITEIGDISYKDNEAVGYEVTVKALPDASENFSYKYIAAPATST